MIQDISLYNNIESLKGRRDLEAVKIAAKEMESLFAYELIKAMREASQESTKGFGSSVYTTLFDMELARLMAERGMGFQEMLLKGLNNRQGLEVSYSQKGFDEIDSFGDIKDSKVNNPSNKPKDLMPGEDLRDLPVNGKISSDFGLRKHPLYGDMRFHHGIDIAAPQGTDIYPVRPGKVIFSGEKNGYGNVVIIDHGDGYTTRYAHNMVNLVSSGDYVSTDTVIAKVGNTGVSTGPHLHFEIRYNDKAIDPVTLVAAKD